MKKLPGLCQLVTYNLILVFFLASLGIVKTRSIIAQGEIVTSVGLQEASFTPVRDLEIGDWVFVKGETGLVAEEISKLEYKQEAVEVYNLSVGGEETFFANDFAVHNKAGSHATICDMDIIQRSPPSETWTLGNHGQAFKNMFQHKGIGDGCSSNPDATFSESAGKNLCFFGSANFCQVAGTCGTGLCKGDRCAYDTCPGPACSCSNNGCSATDFGNAMALCGEYTCGTWGTQGQCCNASCTVTIDYHIDHSAPTDGLRFRSIASLCDGGCGCGSAVKVTPPDDNGDGIADYVIKSMTFDVRRDLCNMSGCQAKLGISRGMTWGGVCKMEPRAEMASITGSGFTDNYTVNMAGGTKYAFIYLDVTTNSSTRPNAWVEISDIKVELVRNEATTTRAVKIINNSILSYAGSADCRWPTVHNGTIWFSNAGESGPWTNETTWSSSGPWTYDWTLEQGGNGYRPVWLKIYAPVQGTTTICPVWINYQGPTPTPTPTPIPVITCTGVDVSPDVANLKIGQTAPFTADAEILVDGSPNPGPDDSYIDQIEFFATTTMGTDPVVCLENTSDCYDTVTNDFPPTDYNVSVIGKSEGQARITAEVSLINGVTCDNFSDPSVVTVSTAESWFQTQGGDVHAQGGITSSVPSGDYFSLDLNDYPGVVSYSSATPDFGSGDVSSKGWLAKDSFPRDYNYSYFHSKLDLPPKETFDVGDIVPGQEKVFYSDDVSIDSDWNFPANTKATILIEGDLMINAKILVPSSSFLAFIIGGGDVEIDGSVGDPPSATPDADIEGVYLIQGDFIACEGCSESSPSNLQLVAEGVFIAQNFNLDYRDLGADNIYPAELFVARPDLVVNLPEALKASYFFEQEITP